MWSACWSVVTEKTGGNSKYSFNNWEDLHLFQWFPVTIVCPQAAYDWSQSAHPLVEFLSDSGFEWHRKALVNAGEFVWSVWGSRTFVWLLSNLFLPIVTFAEDHLTCWFFFFCLLSQGNKVKWQLRICIWVYLFCCLFSSTLKSWAICIKFDSGWRSQRHSVLNSFAKTDVWIGHSPPSKSPQNKVIPHTLKFIRSTQDRNYGALVAHLLKASILCFGECEKAKRMFNTLRPEFRTRWEGL